MSGSAVTLTDRGRLDIPLWIVQALLGVFFVLASAPKLLGALDTVDVFNEIGIGQWFRYVVGGLELAGGIGLLVPRLAGLAGLGLAGVMAGAVVTQIAILDQPAMAGLPFVLLVVAAAVAWGRWPRTRALFGR